MQSNPNNPVILPVNALATYLTLDPHNIMKDKNLFPGLSQYNKYMKAIRYIIKIMNMSLHPMRRLKNCGCTQCKWGSRLLCVQGELLDPKLYKCFVLDV